jgi:hypothetical protein
VGGAHSGQAGQGPYAWWPGTDSERPAVGQLGRFPEADVAEGEGRDAFRGELPFDLGGDDGRWLILVVGGVGARGEDGLKTLLQGASAGLSHAIVALHPGESDSTGQTRRAYVR